MHLEIKKLLLLEWKTIDHEARGRRNNLLFHGIPEVDRELSHKFIRDKLKLGHNYYNLVFEIVVWQKP